MHSKLGSLFCAGGWALSLASGCDDQVGPGYFGESLLTVTGSVEITNGRTRGELSPALGFRNQTSSAITIVDVPVRGTFPSDFRIELYDPPPEETLHHPTRQEEGEPLASIGYITAVSSDHPDVLYWGNSLTTFGYDCKDEGRPDGLCLDRTEETCVVPNPDNIPCYVEKHFCPKGDPESALCVVEISGDPKLASNNVFSEFAGLSQNYQVVYLADAAAPGSATAALLDSEAGVPAGYGLYEIRGITAEEGERCIFDDAPAYKLATDYYNEAHNTDYKSLKCRGLETDAPPCRTPSPEEDILGRTGPQGEVNRLLEKANMELGCPIGTARYKRVDDPANTVISIVIDADQPIGP